MRITIAVLVALIVPLQAYSFDQLECDQYKEEQQRYIESARVKQTKGEVPNPSFTEIGHLIDGSDDYLMAQIYANRYNLCLINKTQLWLSERLDGIAQDVKFLKDKEESRAKVGERIKELDRKGLLD